jgi:RNA polymerase sigma factor (sigma-70 family)
VAGDGKPRSDRKLAPELREIRAAAAQVDNETAVRLWSEYGVVVRRIARRLYAIAERSFIVVTVDDLISIGQVALCEAWTRFHREHPDKTDRGFGQWMQRVVRWRIVESLEQLRPEGLTSAMRADSHNGALHDRAGPFEDPADALHRRELRAWLRSALGQLDSRESILVIAVMNGESLTEAGASLGIGKTRAHQEHERAMVKLRRLAMKAQLMRSGLVDPDCGGLGTADWLEEPLSS